MSGMWTSVVLEFGPVIELRESVIDTVRGVFSETWCEHAEHDPDWIASDGGDFTAMQTNDGHVKVVLEGNTKYEISGDLNAAEAISAVWPDGTVTVDKEWTGDGEPSVEHYEFAAGKRVRKLESQLVEVDAPWAPSLGHDVQVDERADTAGSWVVVEIPSDPDEHGQSKTLAVAEITTTEVRALSAALLKAANGAEFHYQRIEREQAG